MSFEVVETIRAKYPTPLGATHGDFLEECANALSLGLVQKNWGTFVLTRDGIGVSQDCLMAHGGFHWDILVDGEGTAKANWALVTDEHTGEPLILPESRYVAPRKRQDAPGGPIAPPPSDPPVLDPPSDPGPSGELERAFVEFVLATAETLKGHEELLDELDRRLGEDIRVEARTGLASWTSKGHTHVVNFTVKGR
jgi:hypothetical protein